MGRGSGGRLTTRKAAAATEGVLLAGLNGSIVGPTDVC